jgi:sugar O-acyltransferase (sialic acid O-acetyltransferase NeuD family)
MERDLILWGGTGQARVLGEFLPAAGWRIVAVFDNDPAVPAVFPSIPMLHGTDAFRNWMAGRHSPPAALVAVGGDRGEDRLSLHGMLAEAGCPLPAVAHPTAHVASCVPVGDGSQILGMAFVGTGSRIGRSVILNTGARVDHDCDIADGVHLGPGVTLCGTVTVGRSSFVAAGAVVLPRIRIGRGSVVGAGSVVTRDLPDNVVAYGNPARIIRSRPA